MIEFRLSWLTSRARILAFETINPRSKTANSPGPTYSAFPLRPRSDLRTALGPGGVNSLTTHAQIAWLSRPTRGTPVLTPPPSKSNKAEVLKRKKTSMGRQNGKVRSCSAASTADHRVTWTTLRLLATRRDPTYHLCSLYPRMTPPPFVPLSTKVVSFRPQSSYGAGSRASPTTPRRGYVPGLLQAGTQNPCPRDR